MSITLMLVCGAFGLFIILNWKYISDPDVQFRNVISEAIFTSGKGELPLIRDWGFYYPWILVGFLIYFQSFLCIYLLIRKNLSLTLRQLIILISSLIFIMFLPMLLEYLSSFLGCKVLRDLGSRINDINVSGLMILIIILFFTSSILFFSKRYRNHRKFLALTFITVLLNLVFIFTFIELFFD